MSSLLWILVTTFGISLLAWIGVLTLFLRDELLDRLLLILVALAAGALIGGAFLHLIPRTVAAAGDDLLFPFLYLIVGFCLFFVLESFISWHHHHSTTHEHEPVTYLVLISDAVHNFIDGLVIAGSFLSGASVGVVTAIAIGLHEIPQEIGDYGILVYGGFDRRRALALNYLTQATVILGGVVGFYLTDLFQSAPVFLLPFAAGSFIYIASSDLIPEIKETDDVYRSFLYFVVFLAGIGVMLGIRLFSEALRL